MSVELNRPDHESRYLDLHLQLRAIQRVVSQMPDGDTGERESDLLLRYSLQERPVFAVISEIRTWMLYAGLTLALGPFILGLSHDAVEELP